MYVDSNRKVLAHFEEKEVVIPCIAIAKSHIPNLHKSHTNRAYALNANVQIISCRKKTKGKEKVEFWRCKSSAIRQKCNVARQSHPDVQFQKEI